jgi:hypothetical protein
MTDARLSATTEILRRNTPFPTGWRWSQAITMEGKFPSRDRVGVRTPLRCPICDSELDETLVRDIGGVTADLVWQVHAGRCPEHGWFQTEVISRPPREIFPVNKPFGTARRIVVDGQELFSFPTVWNTLPRDQQRARVDPLDARFWRIAPLPAKREVS